MFRRVELSSRDLVDGELLRGLGRLVLVELRSVTGPEPALHSVLPVTAVLV